MMIAPGCCPENPAKRKKLRLRHNGWLTCWLALLLLRIRSRIYGSSDRCSDAMAIVPITSLADWRLPDDDFVPPWVRIMLSRSIKGL